MFFLCYVSSAASLFAPAELLEILAKSREKNSRLGITGLLLYKEGNIMQALEGDEPVVRILYTEIARDPRHHDAVVLLEGVQGRRQFPEWSMGFRELRSPDVKSTPGFSEFLNTPLTPDEFASDPSRCQKLLRMFKRAM